jgi:isoquinoline 1-oxidoreductase beta subunit
MSIVKTSYNRRSFLKVSAASGGGFILGFNWLMSCSPEKQVQLPPSAWYDINAYLKIADNGQVTIMSPNPEIGQNVKTAMPMIVAEELDVDWKDVIVEQAPLSKDFDRQVAGGSQSIRQSWEALRTAGAAARQMLINAASKKWQVNASDCSASNGIISNSNGDEISYGEIAWQASSEAVPEEVKLKEPKDFKIIGTGKGNVDIDPILTGKPLFGLDYKEPNMKYAVVLRPPAFGKKLVSFSDRETLKVNGVVDVIRFGDKIAVLANSTWSAIKGQKALAAEWSNADALESTSDHDKELNKLLVEKSDEPRRNDGNVEKAFADADQIIEKIYEAPFMPHNPMEPQNFFADVTPEKVRLVGPIQTPERTKRRVAELLNRDENDISIDLTRMGGGFGRRLYGDFVLEAAEISKIAKSPVKLVYTREDDMTAGIYRPASKYRFKAGLKDGKLTAYHLVGAGVNMGNSTREHNFPAGSVPNYKVESHRLKSNITTGAWRAPVTNFLACAEQTFIDEIAHEIGADPVQFRLGLLDEVIKNPHGEFRYEPKRMKGVIELAAEKSKWIHKEEGIYKGFSAYYSHNSYVAEVAKVRIVEGQLKIENVVCAVDCGILVNPLGAINQVQGGIIDGIGHAMYGDMTFENGKPQLTNFDKFRLIRMVESPSQIDVHFVESDVDPTGLGEPSLPPAAGALANALFAATGIRFYKQPFAKQMMDISRSI